MRRGRRATFLIATGRLRCPRLPCRMRQPLCPRRPHRPWRLRRPRRPHRTRHPRRPQRTRRSQRPHRPRRPHRPQLPRHPLPLRRCLLPPRLPRPSRASRANPPRRASGRWRRSLQPTRGRFRKLWPIRPPPQSRRCGDRLAPSPDQLSKSSGAIPSRKRWNS